MTPPTEREAWLLAHRLRTSACSEDELREYYELLSQRTSAMGARTLPWAEFYAPNALDKHAAAAAWWPLDCPPALACPSPGWLCLAGCVPASLTPETFMQCLERYWRKAADWLLEQGRSLEQPNEPPDDRRRRMNRERVARYRERTRVPVDAERVRVLYDAYMEACRLRKEGRAGLDARVLAARLEWEQARATPVAPEPPPAPPED